MKKFGLFLCLILLLNCFACLVACNDNSDIIEGQSNIEVLYDFETTDRNLYQIKPHMNFGAIGINKDPQYVSEGTKSYKLEPIGLINTTCKPLLVFPTYSTDFDYDFMDFTQFKSVLIDFYNAESKEVKVDVGLALSAAQYTRAESWLTTSTEEVYTLKPGWNTINYVIQHDLINIRKSIKEVYGVYIAFANSLSMYAKDAPTIYVDNIRLERLSTPHAINSKFELECDEQNGIFEIASFEKEWQKYFVWVSRDRTRWMQPDIELYNPMLGDEIGNVLKFNTRNQAVDYPTFPTTVVSSEMVKQALANAKKNGKTTDSYWFCMDVYNDYNKSIWLRMEFLDSEDKSTALYSKFVMQPKTWTTIEFDLSKLNVVTGKDTAGNTITRPYLDDIGNPVFMWEHYTEKETREFWLDNIRIERRAK